MKIGRRVYGLGAIALGVVGVVFHEFALMWEPVPKTIPAHDVMAYASAAILILGGIALNLPRTARTGAGVLAGFFLLWVLALHLPQVVADPLHLSPWQGMAEVLAITMGGLLAFTLAPGGDKDRNATIARAARMVLGLCLLVFGASHFVYEKYTTPLVPHWLPPSGIFWAYATGVAHIAAGLALLSGFQARLAAVLLTAMFVVFGVLVWVVTVIDKPHEHISWAGFSINLLLIGAAWTAADSLAGKKRR
jgi:uncharacterized membrane protein YphA (DoxX/SURF4 family)